MRYFTAARLKRSTGYRRLEKVTRKLSTTIVRSEYVPEKRVLWWYARYGLVLLLLWKLLDQTSSNHPDAAYACGPVALFNLPRHATHANKRNLIGRLTALKMGYQLGNQVFEILGFEAVARQLGRIPVLVMDDPHNHDAAPQMWSAAYYYPRIFEGYRFWRVPGFNFSAYPTGDLVADYNTFHNISSLEAYHENETIAVNAAYFENYKYMDVLGKAIVRKRLAMPKHTYDFAYELVDPAFHKHTNRLCVHMRRGDYTVNPVLIASNATYTVAAVERILEMNPGDDFGVVIFTDGVQYLEKMMADEPFREVPRVAAAYVPFQGPTKDYVPKHYTWLFLQTFCTHILLTAGRSTFGFFGAYLAPETTKVYYNPYHTEAVPYDLPPEWIALEGVNGR